MPLSEISFWSTNKTWLSTWWRNLLANTAVTIFLSFGFRFSHISGGIFTETLNALDFLDVAWDLEVPVSSFVAWMVWFGSLACHCQDPSVTHLRCSGWGEILHYITIHWLVKAVKLSCLLSRKTGSKHVSTFELDYGGGVLWVIVNTSFPPNTAARFWFPLTAALSSKPFLKHLDWQL